MMNQPSLEELRASTAARWLPSRARRLLDGAKAQVEVDSAKPVTVAMRARREDFAAPAPALSNAATSDPASQRAAYSRPLVVPEQMSGLILSGVLNPKNFGRPSSSTYGSAGGCAFDYSVPEQLFTHRRATGFWCLRPRRSVVGYVVGLTDERPPRFASDSTPWTMSLYSRTPT